MATRAHKKLGSKKICPAIWIVWFLFSVITGFSISAVYITQGTMSDFYNTGDVWDVSAAQIALTASNVQNDPNSGVFQVTQAQAQMVFNSNMKKRKWKYMDMELSALSSNSLKADFYFYKKNGEPAGVQAVTLTEGANRVKLKSKAFSYIVAGVNNQEGVTFSIDGLRIAVREDNVSHKRLLGIGLICSAFCFLLLSLFRPLARQALDTGVFYVPVWGLQKLYCKWGDWIPARIKTIPYKYKRKIRVCLLICLFLTLTILNVYGIFLEEAIHGYVMLLLCTLLVLLAVLSVDGELSLQNWKNPLAMSFLALWCMVCVSDLVVKKKGPVYPFYGVIMVLLTGFLLFVWNQKGKRLYIWQEICRAAEGSFLAAVVFCMLCRPQTEGFRYNGAYINPNPFGLYLAVVGCVFLCELDQYIQGKQKNRVWLAVCCAGLAALVCFLRKSQCTTGTLALAAVAALWIGGYLWRGFFRRYHKRFLCTLVLLAVLYFPVCVSINWGIRTLPYVFHTTVDFPGDQDYAKRDEPGLFMGETVYAAQQGAVLGQESHSKTRLLDKLFGSKSLDALLTGRLVNFTSYLKDMNLFGHSQRPLVYGASTRYAHNGILAYAHMYGVYAVIPYILMNLYFLYYALLYYKRKKGWHAFAYLPLSVCLVFGMENMMDNVDIPFHWIVWFIYIFMLGSFFNFQDKEKKVKKGSP